MLPSIQRMHACLCTCPKLGVQQYEGLQLSPAMPSLLNGLLQHVAPAAFAPWQATGHVHALQGAIDAALSQRAWQRARFPSEAALALRGCDAPEWLVCGGVRRALLALAQALIRCAA